MPLQRTTEGSSSAHSPSREGDIERQRAIFLSYSPKEQARIRADVLSRLRDEAHGREFAACDGKGRRPGSALARLARDVYGIEARDL